jgi:Transposase DNA-binding/Transposase DDE domain
MNCCADRAWAQEEFGDAMLGSTRRTDRLVSVASGVATAPNGRITAVFADAAGREGAFRFVENERVDPRSIGEAAFRACTRRANAYSYVFVPVDGTSLNITDWQRAKGLGIVGARFVGATGLQVMSAIAVAPDGAPLGLCDLRFWTRRGRVRPRGPNDTRKLRSKETVHWLETLGTVQRDFSLHAPNCTPWFQLDRGGDAWPVLETCVANGLTVTVRSSWNRCLWKGGDKPDKYLWEQLERKPVRGTIRVELPPRTGRPGRTAELSIRFAEVVLDLHNRKGKRRRPGPFSAVLVGETGRVPDGVERIEWLLLTTYPVDDLDDALAVIDGYTARWTIEEFHRTWKSGACDVETTQLGALDHIQRWATILAG